VRDRDRVAAARHRRTAGSVGALGDDQRFHPRPQRTDGGDHAARAAADDQDVGGEVLDVTERGRCAHCIPCRVNE